MQTAQFCLGNNGWYIVTVFRDVATFAPVDHLRKTCELGSSNITALLYFGNIGAQRTNKSCSDYRKQSNAYLLGKLQIFQQFFSVC